jgi:predicted DNA-binding transcriptional regulator AlpA
MNPPIAGNAKLLTTEEAAAILDVRPQTLAVWRSSKRHGPPYVKIGHNIRYRMRDLEAWLESRTVGATQDGNR